VPRRPQYPVTEVPDATGITPASMRRHFADAGAAPAGEPAPIATPDRIASDLAVSPTRLRARKR
jgi:hypothetical protein